MIFNTNLIDRKLQMRNEAEITTQKELNNWKSLFETLICPRESNKFNKGFENLSASNLYTNHQLPRVEERCFDKFIKITTISWEDFDRFLYSNNKTGLFNINDATTTGPDAM